MLMLILRQDPSLSADNLRTYWTKLKIIQYIDQNVVSEPLIMNFCWYIEQVVPANLLISVAKFQSTLTHSDR